MDARSVYSILLILYFTVYPFVKIEVNCATYENVSLTLTTRWTALYIDGVPPKKHILIRSDYTLVEYANNQVFEVVKFENQKIPKLTTNSVANLPNISDIVIVGCGLRSIQPGTFKNLPSLEFLNLTGNLLEKIEDGVFGELPRLNYLHLDNNRISKLGDNVFGNLIGLGHLFISNNKLSYWKNQWFVGTVVESVDMDNNLVEEIPANAFQYFVDRREDSRLWYLVLSNNQVKKIHPDAFNGLTELAYLNLTHNHIQELPSGVFRTVKYINNFDLSDNEINTIDVTGVFKNTKLTYVKLRNNRLSCVPVDIVNVTDIYNLNIDGNPITCECVEAWKNWQSATERNVVSLNNIQKNC